MISYINLVLDWGKTLPVKEQNDLISLFKSVNFDSIENFEKKILEMFEKYPSLSGTQKLIFPHLAGHIWSVSNQFSAIFKPNSKIFIKEFVSYFIEEE